MSLRSAPIDIGYHPILVSILSYDIPVISVMSDYLKDLFQRDLISSRLQNRHSLCNQTRYQPAIAIPYR